MTQEKRNQPSPAFEDMSNRSSEAVKDLLLVDHAHFSSMFANSEQAGETRVNWFIGIVTATSGGLLALLVKQSEQTTAPLLEPSLLFAIALAALSALLVFGLLTLRRIMLRNASSDRQKRALDQIRQMFQDHFDPQHLLIKYHPLGSPEVGDKKDRRPKEPVQKSNFRKLWDKLNSTKESRQPTKEGPAESKNPPQEKSEKKYFREFWDELNDTNKLKSLRRLGGLAHTVAAINSLLIAALAAVILSRAMNLAGSAIGPRLVEWLTLPVLILVITFALQWFWIGFAEYKEQTKLRAGDCTHAGGVVFRLANDNIEYLLLRPPSDPAKDEWVLPKGKIKTYESHQVTAIREVAEEAEVRARIVDLIGEKVFKARQERVQCKFYLMESIENFGTNDQTTFWADYNEAHKLLTFPESKSVLAAASQRLQVLVKL